MLVSDPGKPYEFVEVHSDGKRVPSKITHDGALNFAKQAAEAFGIGADRLVEFDKERAKKDVKGEGDAKSKGKKGAKKPDAAEVA